MSRKQGRGRKRISRVLVKNERIKYEKKFTKQGVREFRKIEIDLNALIGNHQIKQ